MKYILTIDDLKTLGNGIRNANSMSVEEHLDAFLADKPTTDWQVIASGEVKICEEYESQHLRFYDKDRKPKYQRLTYEDFAEYEGKDIEIIVRVKQ